MTFVKFEPGSGFLSVSGHAGSAPRGRDLVCAALSILAETAAAQPGARTRRGEALVEIEAAPEKLAALAPGFRLLARDWPQFVTYEEET